MNNDIEQHEYASRRTRLMQLLTAEHYAPVVVIVCAAYEQARFRFVQESNFRYLTGLSNPGAVLLLEQNGKELRARLYVPHSATERAVWIDEAEDEHTLRAAFELCPLGAQLSGYSAVPHITYAAHERLLQDLQSYHQAGARLYMSLGMRGDCIQRRIMEQWRRYCPELIAAVKDCSADLARLRRVKSAYEVAQIKQAIASTAAAIAAAQLQIRPGSSEAIVHAALVAHMLRSGAGEAFPSIVGSGLKSTVLHYERNNAPLYAGDLVVVDCGALWNGYAADISRTFPVSGRFTERQRSVYAEVLAVQELIRAAARPGVWLRNAQFPEESLHHIAVQAFARVGLDRYFPHSIGHFLGLDLHDVGDLREPLVPGDVITIEPGLYCPAERLGIRIEDDFLITEQGALCLSDAIPRDMGAIEQ